MSRVLFVGGSKDGQVLDVDTTREYIEVPVKCILVSADLAMRPQSEVLKTETYVRERLRHLTDDGTDLHDRFIYIDEGAKLTTSLLVVQESLMKAYTTGAL